MLAWRGRWQMGEVWAVRPALGSGVRALSHRKQLVEPVHRDGGRLRQVADLAVAVGAFLDREHVRGAGAADGLQKMRVLRQRLLAFALADQGERGAANAPQVVVADTKIAQPPIGLLEAGRA